MGSASKPSPTAAAPSRRKVALCLTLLTLQYGAQPLISKRCVGQGVIVTSLVLAIEFLKVICAVILLVAEGSLKAQFSNWSLVGSLTASGLPAAIYALQNSLLQISYKNLDSLTFSILNQTKLLFTAFFTYLILGQKQSPKQILALALLITAAVLLSIGESSRKGASGGSSDYVLLYGILPVTVASVLSGLASSLCQWASQVKKHTSYMMTIEMSFIGSMCLLASTFQSPDGEALRIYGFFHEWTLWTVIPVLMNAVGGILVGLVTSYAGGFCDCLGSPRNCITPVYI
uniref:CMP-sialic acid transporter 5 n=1 Tax=Triticum aestivum TaxID=4565 RepID=A0A3B6NNP9_WHEAT